MSHRRARELVLTLVQIADGTEYGVFGGYNCQGASALDCGVEAQYNRVDAQGSDVLDYLTVPAGGAAADGAGMAFRCVQTDTQISL